MSGTPSRARVVPWMPATLPTERGRAATLLIVLVTLLAAHGVAPPWAAAARGTVTATVETQPVGHSGDAADDPAVWVHPTDPSRSAIVGTDKQGGLYVYDIGTQLQYLPSGEVNNVDVRSVANAGRAFVLGGQGPSRWWWPVTGPRTASASTPSTRAHDSCRTSPPG